MIDFAAIAAQYVPFERTFKRNILREYLQYKILQSIFDSPFASKLAFLGGTAIRIVHGSKRFSEDLDFDDRGLSREAFEQMTRVVKRDLEREGYRIETRHVYKGAYRCYVNVLGILFEHGLSGHRGEKMLIQIDTAPHHYSYQPDRHVLNRFDVFTHIFVTPPSVLLSMKLCAAFGRARLKGRDFYDIIYLLGRTKPDYQYLHERIHVSTPEVLRAFIREKSARIDFGKLTRDVAAFLVNSADTKMITLFPEYIEQVAL